MAKQIMFKSELVRAILDGRKTQTRRVMKGQPQYGADVSIDFQMRHNRPRYQVRDVLLVREAWAVVPVGGDADFVYKADNPTDALKPKKWRPAIHMPNEAARLFLVVTKVRAERIHSITEKDAVAEGCVAKPKRLNLPAVSARDEFIKLWQRICTGDGETWDENPFVYVYEFAVKEVKK